MKLLEFLSEEDIITELQGQTKTEVIAELARQLAQRHAGLDANDLTRALMAREELASTAVGDQIAIPHVKSDHADRLIGCLGRSTSGVDFDSIDGLPTHLFFTLIAPASLPGIHLKTLARISHLFRSGNFRSCLMKAPTASEMFGLIKWADTSL